MATRKVFDIIPPKEPKESAHHIKPQKKPAFAEKLVPQAKQIVAESASQIKAGVGKKALWWPIFTIIALIVAAGASYLLIKPKAELEIWPVKAPLEAKIQAVVGSDIAGELKTLDCPVSQEFTATGVKSINTKATGTVRIYNAYSTSPQTLVASTRFVSDNGKLFRIPQKVVIPGAHYEGSKLVPGEVDAKVEAGEPGEEYNISPSTFSLPAFAGTSRYTAFYAKSSSAMSGGSKIQTTQVSVQDLAEAEKTLIEKALTDCQKSLTSSLSLEDYVVVEDAVKSEVIKTDTSAKAGQEVDKFTYNVKAKATALVFKQSALSDFVRTYILSKVPAGTKLKDDSVKAGYSAQSVDLVKGKIVLSLQISAQAYSIIDENSIKEAVKSESPDEIAVSLKGFPQVDKFQLRLWPFWVNKAPLDQERISIKLRLD